MPLLDKRAVNEAVQFDSLLRYVSMPTRLDSLIIGALGIDLGRLHKDHIRDLVVSEIFAVRRAWGMSPIQIVLYLEGSTTSGHT